MTSPAEYTRRVQFQQQGPDANGDDLGGWVDVIDRQAKITPLKLTNVRGAEPVIAQRLLGEQPVVITVRRDRVTRGIDNTFRAYDLRGVLPPTASAAAWPGGTIWAISSAIWNERENEMEFLAVQRRNGSDA